jgi:DNA-binding NarL/FixJ family response regulator
MMSAATVLLVEDHPIYREGLRRVLESQDALTIVGETDTVRGALEQARAQRPDLILLDLGLKDGSGLDALPRLLAECQETRVIVLSGYGAENVLPALRAGARGFVSKDTASSQILKAIHAVLSGELWAERRMTAQLVDELFRQKQERQAVETLTPRERQVLRLVGEGKRNAEIAGALFISEHTVKTHMSSLMHKLKIEGRSRLALYAARCDAGLH